MTQSDDTSPLPKKSLSGHCSAIDDDTLYVLSPDSFQSLPLKNNATWSTLEIGVSVTGAACTKVVPDGDESQAALYVIGGTTSDSTYGGLQRYFFANSTWETLSPTTTDIKGRTNHGVAYLNASQSILIYAGSQAFAASDYSSQTFLLSATSPWNILSFSAQTPPASQPILLPWDEKSAVMVGGSDTNERIYTFDPDDGWQALDTNLTSAISTGARGVLVEGSDGSKVLQVFDASASPNTVESLVLLAANGKTASNGKTVGGSSSKRDSTRRRKRDLTLSDWPDYNSTDAPSVKRSEYAVASSSDGLTVLSGGNDDSPINIFNSNTNSWENNKAFFGDSADQTTTTSSSATSTVASSTSSAAAATSSTAATNINAAVAKNHTRRTLGIALGVLCGVAVIFILALLYFRRKKQKQKQNSAYVDEKEADRMSFADRGASFMKEAEGSVQEHRDFATPPRAPFHGNNESQSSIAIITGRFGNKRHSRNTGEKGSFESTAKLVRPQDSHRAFGEPMEMEYLGAEKKTLMARKPVGQADVQPPPPIAETTGESRSGTPDADALQNPKKRSSGWSRYFAQPEEANAGLAPYNPAENQSALSVSAYTDSRGPSMLPYSIPSSALVPPLDIEFNKALEAHRISIVSKGQPSFMNSNDDLVARGGSLDIAAGSRAEFHTGTSNEPEHYLDRDSIASSRRHSADSALAARPDSTAFFGTPTNERTTSPWVTPSSSGNNLGSGIKEIHIPPSNNINTYTTTPTGTTQPTRLLGVTDSVANFPRPPSSVYTASHYDRESRAPTYNHDSRLPNLPPGSAITSPDPNGWVAPNNQPGRGFGPSGPAPLHIPGPAARSGNTGFFPGNRDNNARPGSSRSAKTLETISARKLGGLHPGTIAALSKSGAGLSPVTPVKPAPWATAADRDSTASDATVWPSASGMRGPSDSYMAERERLMREREQKARENLERERNGGQGQMSPGGVERGGTSGDMSWLNLQQR